MPKVTGATTQRFHNRQEGLTRKSATSGDRLAHSKLLESRPVEVNKIVSSIRQFVVPIDSLTPDPDNAMAHPDRNMASIKESFRLYGQRFPIIAREDTRIIVVGNGRWQAAKELGWTEIAADLQPFSEIEALGFGIADNKTAKLAQWKVETLGKLLKLAEDTGHGETGWTLDELEVLRAADYTPPAVDESAAFAPKQKTPTLAFSDEQWVIIEAVISCLQLRAANGEVNGSELADAECVTLALKEWLEHG